MNLRSQEGLPFISAPASLFRLDLLLLLPPCIGLGRAHRQELQYSRTTIRGTTLKGKKRLSGIFPHAI